MISLEEVLNNLRNNSIDYQNNKNNVYIFEKDNDIP